jgi:hypothetical protein
MIVAAQDQTTAQQLAVGMAGSSGANMWVIGLSPTGVAPATFYISNGMIQDNFAALLGDTQATYDAAGGAIPLASIQGLYSRATFKFDVDPFQVMSDLGLQFVEAPNA